MAGTPKRCITRLGAVMARADRDAFVVEHGAHVVGMDAFHDEREDARLLRARCR